MRRALGTVLIGLAALTGVLGVTAFQTRSRPPAAFAVAGAATADQPNPAEATPTSTAKPPGRRAPARRAPDRAVGFQPSSVSVPSLGIQASVSPVLSIEGQLQPPEDPKQVGWWQGSALGGSASGSTVLVGHVDSAQDGLGAFYRLDQVSAGSVVTVLADGRSASYRVTSLQYLTKSDGLPATLFTAGGPARLILITCGGSFDRQQQSYRDNVVVTAVPARG